MLKLYIRPVCFQRPEEEENSLSLLVESRREKVRTIKGKENRSRSIAAGLLLRHMLLEEQIPYAEESFGLEGHGKPRLKKDGVFFNLSHAGAYAVGALSDVPVGVDVDYGKHRSPQDSTDWLPAQDRHYCRRNCQSEPSGCLEQSGGTVPSLHLSGIGNTGTASLHRRFAHGPEKDCQSR